MTASPSGHDRQVAQVREALLLADVALRAVEWTGGSGIWSWQCCWCGGYERHPAMDQDYYGRAGHKPDCPRQTALAAITEALEEEGR